MVDDPAIQGFWMKVILPRTISLKEYITDEHQDVGIVNNMSMLVKTKRVVPSCRNLLIGWRQLRAYEHLG